MSNRITINPSAILEGEPFAYDGPFINLNGGVIKYDNQKRELLDSRAAEIIWTVDRMGESFADEAKFIKLKAQLNDDDKMGDFTSPGFRIFNHRYGFIEILFSQCIVKEADNV